MVCLNFSGLSTNSSDSFSHCRSERGAPQNGHIPKISLGQDRQVRHGAHRNLWRSASSGHQNIQFLAEIAFRDNPSLGRKCCSSGVKSDPNLLSDIPAKSEIRLRKAFIGYREHDCPLSGELVNYHDHPTPALSGPYQGRFGLSGSGHHNCKPALSKTGLHTVSRFVRRGLSKCPRRDP